MPDIHRSDTRERLLDAATEVFAERGYEAATVREICRRAQANVAAVNYYFGDKKQLYAAIFDRVFELVGKHRVPFLHRDAPPAARLRVFLQSLFGQLFCRDEDTETCLRVGAMYLMEMARPTDVLDRMVAEHISRDAEEIHSIVTALLGAGADPETVTDTVASVAGQVLFYYHVQPIFQRLFPDLPPPEQRIDRLVDHIWHFSLGGVERVRSRTTGSGSST